MTSLHEYYPGRRVSAVDKNHHYHDQNKKMVIIRLTKKGKVICACDDGEQVIFNSSCELDVWPEN